MQNENPLSNVESLIESFHRLKTQQRELDIANYGQDELEQLTLANYHQLAMTRSRLLLRGIDPDKITDIPHD